MTRTRREARGVWRKVVRGVLVRLRFALVATAVVAAAACGTLVGNPGDDAGDGKTEPTPAQIAPPAPVPVVFALTDAPIDDARNVFVRIESLQVAAGPESDAPDATGGANAIPANAVSASNSTVWVDVPLAVHDEIDVLSYQDGATLTLAEAPALAPGQYARTRLTLAASPAPRLVDQDGAEHPIDLASVPDRVIEVRAPFVVAAPENGEPTRVTLDFDLRRSLKTTASPSGAASYALAPSLRLVEARKTGKLVGAAVGARSVCVFAAAGATKDADDDCAHAVTSTKVHDGKYTIAFLPAGAYVVRAYRKGATPLDSATVEVQAGATTKVESLTAGGEGKESSPPLMTHGHGHDGADD
jgi:hypothetical protein